MLTFLAGIGTGLIVAVAVGAWSGARVSKRQRRINALFGVYQRAVWDVQDATAFLMMDPPMGKDSRRDEVERWKDLRDDRDQALAAYLAAMGE